MDASAGTSAQSGIRHRRRAGLWFAALMVLALAVAAAVYLSRSGKTPSAADLPSGPPPAPGIGCLGRIEPEDGVIRLAVRAISGQPSIVGELYIKEGDPVKKGQLLAVLESKGQLETAWRQAEAQLRVADYRLRQVKTGAKSADIAAQEAEIGRWKVELENARTEYDRYRKLVEKGVVPAAELDTRRAAVESRAQLLAQARARLESLSEIRKVDVEVAEAEAEAARLNALSAQSEFSATLIHSPISGRVLKINAWPGEEVGSEGLAELGKTDRMYVVAEVMETDVSRVRLGQTAVITSAALSEPLEGRVELIGTTVAKNDVLHVDPAAYSDIRVVEVRIRLAESKRAAGLINGQVNVVIKID